MKNIFLYILLVLVGHLYAQDDNWKSISNKNYTITYPNNWTANTKGEMGTSFTIKSPLEVSDDFRENVNLVIQDLSAYDGLNLDRFIEISIGQISSMIADGNLKSNARKGNKHELVYLYKQGNFTLKVMQWVWVKDQQAYILTFTAKADAFDTNLNDAHKIMKSFTIK